MTDQAQGASPKLTVGEDATSPINTAAGAASAAAEFTQDAMAEEVIPAGSLGTVTFKKPHILAQFRIVEAVGPDLAENQTYMQMINPLIYCAAINGDPVFLPKSKLEVEALIQRLGEEGLTALATAYVAKVVQPTRDAYENAKRLEEEKAQLKNG